MSKDQLKSPDFLEMRPEIQFGATLTNRICEKVMPVYGIKQKDVPINKISKDYNYTVDVIAEEEIRKAFQELWGKGISYGYVTEDQGLVMPPGSEAEFIYMIDPVDGSRPAQIGAEMATVTMVGVKGDKKNPSFSDIEFGITQAIKENRVFLTRKGEGVFERINGRDVPLEKRKNPPPSLKDATLVYETYSMSPTYTGIVIEPLIREVSFKTEYPCGSYCALSLVRGQNEFHVDLRKRLLKDSPNLNIAIKTNAKSLFPMDIAAGYLMIKELGGKVTDAYGDSLENVRLWMFEENGAWSSENEISWIAAVTPELHAKAFEKIEEGIRNLKSIKSRDL